MQLIRFWQGDTLQAAWVKKGQLWPVANLWPELADDWRGLLQHLMQPDARVQAKAHVADVPSVGEAASIRYALPALSDSKILCVGLNYAAHAAEGGRDVPELPIFFIRYPSSFVAAGEALRHPAISDKYDYEGELVVVVGQALWRASEAEAEAAIVGYMLGMDGSVRDFQKRTPQWTLGKNFDASGALGPGLTLAEDMPAGAVGVTLTTTLNGQELQHGHTDDLIFTIPHLLAELSQVMRLQAGDMLLTGTPEGVGFARHPRIWLQPGDKLKIAATGLEPLELSVAAGS